MKKPAKIDSQGLLEMIRQAILSGNYRDTSHGKMRGVSRFISRLEMEYVLLNGWHEKRKDTFEEQHTAWNYAIRGKTLDSRNLRIIVSFDDDGMLVVTKIDLEKKD